MYRNILKVYNLLAILLNSLFVTYRRDIIPNKEGLHESFSLVNTKLARLYE